MVEQFILNDLKDIIDRGKDILESREFMPLVYDVPIIDEKALKSYKKKYEDWRKMYDEIIAQLEMRGVAMNISKITAEDEQRIMFLNVRDIHDQNRNITNALTKHIEELKEILEGIDYVEIDVREQIDRFKQMYRYDDKKACEEFKNYVLELLRDNPKMKYVLDLRKMNLGDNDLLENIGQLMFATHSEGRIILEPRSQEDANIIENHLHKTQRNLPIHIKTEVREAVCLKDRKY